MTSTDLAGLLKRLEKATARLEEVAAGRSSPKTAGSSAAAGAANSPGDGLSADSGSDHPAVREYDSAVKPLIDEFVSHSEQIGDVVEAQAQAVSKLAAAQRNFVRVAVQARKPLVDQLPALLEPQQATMVEIIGLKDSNRPSQYYNHLSTVAEGIAAFGWVAVEPTPVPYINDMKDSAQFYGNRVLKEWKEKDEVHAKWVRSFLSALRELAAYVKQFHTTGISWSPKGAEVEQALKAIKGEAAAAPAAAASGGAPPPPPPPPPPMVTDFEDSTTSSSGAPAQSHGALFAELSKGDAVTSGLRKVDKSEMTHKNPSLRAGSTVSSAPKAAEA
ncbi:suppressor of rasval19, partial [Dipsacomyces acuminosporus]